MSNLIVNNAYRILGLDGSANQKDILKRSKEIINRLKIDDYPEYTLDINLPKKFRTEESVNDSLNRLQNMKNNLNEYFFWFNISDTVDENAFDYLQYGDAASYDEAIQIWKNASNTENSTGLLYKKNLALLYCLMLLNEENDIYLKESLSNWKEIIDSDKFWSAFEKSYAVNNDQTINSDRIIDFRENIVKYISDIYHDLYLQHGNKKYVKDFQDIFGTLGDKTEENLLKPIHQSIYDTIKKLEKISLDKNDDIDDEIIETDNVCDNCGKPVSQYTKKYDDGSVLCQECYVGVGKEWKKRIKEEETVEGSTKIILKVKRITMQLELQLDQLREIGLYDDEQSKVVRDHAAEAIRGISIIIHNEAHMKTQSIELLDLAKKIAGTDSIKEKFQSDLKTIEGYIETDQESTLSFDMGGFLRKKQLKVTNDFIEYKQKKIYYKDAISIALYNDGEDYTFLINSHKDKMKIKFTNHENINKVYAHMQNVIDPVIVEKLVKLIFEEDTTISIGSVNFDKNGYHSSKMFRAKSVLWTEQIHPPLLDGGNVILYKVSKPTVALEFAIVPIKNLNGIIIPELVESCYKEYHALNQSGV
jgi:hypothetical protein